ncbi:MAG: hypothetical protein WBB65_12945 [Anaerolineales bacterium]
MDPTDSPVTNTDIWGSTAVFAIIGILLLLPLVYLYPDADFLRSPLAVATASGIFWGLFSVIAFRAFWDLYYQYFYPRWVRPLAPLNIILYALFGLVMWSLANRFNTLPTLMFILFGGTEGLLEHLIGVNGLRVLEKVPVFNALDPIPVFIFSFFEYIVYWSIVAWLALALTSLLPQVF